MLEGKLYSWSVIILAVFTSAIGSYLFKASINSGASLDHKLVLGVLVFNLSTFLWYLALKEFSFINAGILWVALDTVLAIAIGIYIFKEPMTVAKFACIILIIGATIGLQMSENKSKPAKLEVGAV